MYISERVPKFVDVDISLKKYESVDSFITSNWFKYWTETVKPIKFEIIDMVDPTGYVLENEYQLIIYDKKGDCYNIATVYECQKKEKEEIAEKLNL